MRKRAIWIILSVLLISMMIVGSVYAFYKGNIDGVWGLIDPHQYIDIIGQIGTDPGTEWGTGDTSTADNTLIRMPGICYGDVNGTDAFDPADEWIGYPDQTYTGLGSHTYTCSGTGLIISQYVETSTGRQIIEIFNATDYPIALLGYKIQIFSNGSLTPTTTIDLTTTATLVARDVWVVSDADYGGIIEDQVTSALNFDGNDVVALVRGSNAGENYEGAACNNWATGPTGTDPDAAPTSWQGTWWDQSTSTTDWNQVRYGVPEGYGGCPTTNTGFLRQSGFGFDGMDIEDPLVYYGENVPFVMGILCHYNNPIYSQSNELKLQSVPLTVTVGGIRCDDNSEPLEGDSTDFTYYLRLDETTNSNVPLGDCPYPSTISCSDGVFISQPPPDQEFTCDYGTSEVTYTIITLGFMEEDESGDCPEWNAAMARRDFISEEGDTNCSCMYGMIADEVPTAVELLYFTATAGEGAISLDWATASETDNFGFNLYRASSKDGERVQLNADLIPSNMAPGSPYGAEYQFLDETVEPGVRYFYWLEDVDVLMKPTLHGPVDAILE